MPGITHVTASVSTLGGGISLALMALVSAQADAGVTVSVVGQCDGGKALHGWPSGSLQVLPVRRLPGMCWSVGMRETISALQPDLIHCHGLWEQPSISVPRHARRHQLPYVVSPHGMLDPWALSHSGWKKRMASLAYEMANLRGASCLHALCESEAQSMRVFGLKNPVAVIPNGVDLPEIRNPTSGHRPPTLLFLGRLHPKKGLVNALRAWAKIRRQETGFGSREEWQFVIAGWDQGGHEAELKRLCKELGLAYAETSAAELVGDELASHAVGDKWAGPAVQPYRATDHRSTVLFTGPAFGEQKDALLRSASAFILPSFSEGLPMSVLEAWSYQLPVLMTDHCNLPEGFAADAALRIGTDIESIAEGMRLLIRSPISDLRSLGQNGRALVEGQFTWPMVAAQMKEVYDWVLGVGAKPECVR